MNDRKAIEAILLVADEPVGERVLGEVLERPVTEIRQMLASLAQEYRQADRGFVLRAVAGGWRLYTDPECLSYLERFVTRRGHSRLTAAALEVLAIIAYRGPLSRSQIAEIRGVDSDGVVRTLLSRGLLRPAGKGPGPGGPELLEVGDEFLERAGLESLADLPPLADFMPDSDAVEEMEARLSPGM